MYCSYGYGVGGGLSSNKSVHSIYEGKRSSIQNKKALLINIQDKLVDVYKAMKILLKDSIAVRCK